MRYSLWILAEGFFLCVSVCITFIFTIFTITFTLIFMSQKHAINYRLVKPREGWKVDDCVVKVPSKVVIYLYIFRSIYFLRGKLEWPYLLLTCLIMVCENFLCSDYIGRKVSNRVVSLAICTNLTYFVTIWKAFLCKIQTKVCFIDWSLEFINLWFINFIFSENMK